MKKDIFNGNIQKQYIGYVKFSIILATVLFSIFAIFFLMIALFYDNVEPSARIFISIFSIFCLLAAISYPILTMFAIKTYPKHKKLAHGMLKEFVFETNETRIINNIREFGKLNASEFPRSYELTTDNIINHIPSKEIRKYLLKNKKKITIMQYATLVENYYKGNMVAIFEALRDFTDNSYEKELFTIAMKDFRKYKRIDDRTIDYYLKNDSREKKPMCPFEEFIFLPTMFKEYELALYLVGEPKIVLIGRSINFDENNKENALNYDFSDLSYIAYDIETPNEIIEQNLVKIHIHAHYCELEKIKELKLTQEQLERCTKLIEFLKNYYQD